jgi:hypothetical protein
MTGTFEATNSYQMESLRGKLDIFFAQHSRSVFLEARLLKQLREINLPPDVRNTVQEASRAFKSCVQAQSELSEAIGMGDLDLAFPRESADC